MMISLTGNWKNIFGFPVAAFTVASLSSALACAQIRTDGSVGPAAQTLTAPGGNFTIPQTLGRLSGANLFHSFQDFNVNTGESATFTTSTSGISNVISRVTGGNVSNINGALALKPTDGAPAFWFVNPAGIVFGSGASIDMPGAFHVSTAHYLKFSDGNFYSDTQKVSTFSSAPPEAFGFLGTSRASIQVNGATLSNGDNKINLVAGDITIDGGTISNSAGAIILVAVGDMVGEVSPSGIPDLSPMGAIKLINGAMVGPQTSSDLKSGDLLIKAGTLLVDNSTLISDTTASGNGGAVTIVVADEIKISNESYVGTKTTGAGNAGHVNVQAGSLLIDSSGLAGDSDGEGDGGSVTVEVSGGISLLNSSYISSDSGGGQIGGKEFGNGGNVSISAGSLNLDSSYINSNYFGEASGGNIRNAGNIFIHVGNFQAKHSQISSITCGNGDSGDITIAVDGAMSLLSNSALNTSAFANFSGKGGDISIRAGSLQIDNSNIVSVTFGNGNSGNINIEVNGAMSLVGNGNSGLNTSAYQNSSGKSGDISIRAGSLQVDNSSLQSSTFTSGNSGNINIEVNNSIDLTGDTFINTSAVENSSGKGGNISIRAGSLHFDNSDIQSVAAASGDSGNVSIEVSGLMSMVNDSAISTNTEPKSIGNAGDILVRAGSLQVDKSTLQSISLGSGNSGNVSIEVAGAMTFIAEGDSLIGSPTAGIGNGGNVSIKSESLLIDNAYILAQSGNLSYGDLLLPSGSGNSGNVNIQVSGSLVLLNGGEIGTSTYLVGNAGNVSVNAGSMVIDSQGTSGQQSSVASGSWYSKELTQAPSGNAGTVTLKVAGALSMLNGGVISTTTESPAGKGGSIFVEAKNILIDGKKEYLGDYYPSRISASAVLESSGQAGSVNISAQESIQIHNGGEISATNWSVVQNPNEIKPTSITISAPKIKLATNGQITTESTGNVNASNIKINFTDVLNIDPTAITTSAFDGNGGSIDIAGNGLMILDRSAITTSVTGLTSGNAGSINIAVKTLMMSNGFIQANTSAPLASGGTISISAEALVSSYGTLLLGGSTPYAFDLVTTGFNVIQAASPTGVSGDISITSPNLDMAGKLASLKVNLLDTGGFSKNPCASAGKSAFSQSGRGGLPASSYGALSSQETRVVGLKVPSSKVALASMSLPHRVQSLQGCSG
jgi:filamentous hemagglutinin family protein